MLIKKIFDKTVDCACNKDDRYCNHHCMCYCHIPIWYRNLVWKTQDIKGIGNILVVILMAIFQIPITIFMVFSGEERKLIH